MDRKLILFETNEVPYRVIDAFARAHPSSAIARLLRDGRQFETVTDDRIALDPWISWPTFHRGVNDEKHGILHLGQQIDSADAAYPPIWSLLKRAGVSVGVFGSLHSSNVPADASEYSFFIPDYFASEAFAHPRQLLPFQQMNLVMTRASARNVVRSVPAAAWGFIRSLPGLGVRLSTLLDLACQLGRETFNKALRIRRRTYQALVMGDLFIAQLERSRPQFASFYTNHVAAAMHRYWGATFPEDYGKPLDDEWIRAYRGEIEFAMNRLDVLCERLLQFVRRHPEYVLMVASSLGQAAIPAEKTFQFLTITDLERFMAALGVPREGWVSCPAMVPCQSVNVEPPYRDALRRGLESLRIDGREGKWDKRPVGPFSYDEAQPGSFQFFIQFDSYQGSSHIQVGDRQLPLEEAGLGSMAHEDGVNCTAQHVPEGCLIVYDQPGLDASPVQRPRVSTTDVVPSILRFFGLPIPAYLQGSASIPLPR